MRKFSRESRQVQYFLIREHPYCVSEHVYKRSFKNVEILSSLLAHIVGVCGEVHNVLGQVTLPFRLGVIALEHMFQLFEK